ncbi:MAG: class I SAM-dependent methyltransferase [Cyanobacteria bacterium]|nr:class I SAM-dependent methyltransferase [Cyanobacteria bacterium CG_2015-16_32_12]NCO78649.1 class I SAM-dependent methyltransferase [Cyanobacteria bacterium CG_2015-22_32_23]NCQ04654.1 class I SAM-dependent methyltransferase [Cyanobacteria bacterium CG_2015-09_32_10]NCQ42514.1 class I SAM-dependent methyltransferase [Cyanobacteria bacterium CG_2015-04_32_10]NCS85997.1 class I SAM-dependent methyltransferase [Cyanobacteria bacterium CG_2015-02_32_10]
MSNLDSQTTINNLASEYCQKGNPTGWFEEIYSQANQNPANIPWVNLSPNPYLTKWLSQYSGMTSNALVVGCGLGDDAEILQQTGFNVTAFDVSTTAINWCKKRFPNSEVNYLTADLFNLPSAWQNQFNLVWECRTIQALPLDVREKVIQAISSMVKPLGTLLVVTHSRDNEVTSPIGPPWPLNDLELNLFSKYGLTENKRTLSYSNKGTEILNLKYLKN